MIWLLAAMMLLGAHAPFAVQHAHVGGEGAHEHSEAHAHDRHQQHSHHSHVHHATQEAEAVGGVVSVAHYHFEWFGFAFSLPNLPSESNEKQSPGEPISFVQIGVSETLLPRVELISPEIQGMWDHCASVTAVMDAPQVAAAQSLTPPLSSLCGAARANCSSVLRI
jgi:hypothetical protein